MITAELQQLVKEYVRRWNSGAPPNLDEFLFSHPDVDQAELLQELFRVELRYRAIDDVRELARGLSTTLSTAHATLEATASGLEDTNDFTGSEHPTDGESKSASEPFDDITKAAAPADHQSTSTGDRPARCFGDYELLVELGRGGMGVVYKARQISLNRIVALKTILAPHFASEEKRIRFRREAEASAKLDHVGIVTVFDSGIVEDCPYFSMTFVEGGTLSSELRRGLFHEDKAAESLRNIATAVAYAHEAGVVHRDLKPSNILLDGEGRPQVSDFGLAKLVEGNEELTGSGNAIGTPSYMAPEQARGEASAIGPAVDIYSLGAILYRMLAGRAPFQEDTPTNTLLAVMNQEVVPPRKLRPKISPDLETICLKCLEKDPADRYDSAATLADDLGRYLADEPILAKPAGILRSSWRWYTGRRDSATIVAGGFAFVTGFILLIWNCIGATAVLTLDRWESVRDVAIIEVGLGALLQSIPAILAGWAVLKRLRWSLYFGVAVCLNSWVFTLGVFTGQVQVASLQSQPLDALGALLFVLATIGLLLHSVALYAHRERRLKAT